MSGEKEKQAFQARKVLVEAWSLINAEAARQQKAGNTDIADGLLNAVETFAPACILIGRAGRAE